MIRVNKKYQPHLFLIGANLLYGLNYSIAKIALPNFVTPSAFIMIRVMGGAFLFWLLHRLWVSEPVKRKHLPLLLLCSIFGVVINQTFFFEGLARTTEINAALIMITTPIFVLAISAAYLKEALTAAKIVGIVIGALGAGVIIAFGESFSFGSKTWRGDLFILINAISYGLYLVLVKSLMKTYNPITIIKWVFLFALLFVVPLGWQDFQNLEPGSFTNNVWLSIFYVVIGTTFLAYLFNISALKNANPSMVSAYIYSQPLIASVVAIFIQSDRFGANKVIGGLLIFAGLYLVSLYRPKSSGKGT